MEVIGRLVKILPEVKGTSKNGEWRKQEIIIETAEQYPKKVCVSLWGDKVDALAQFKMGDYMKASVNLESREYNERWYTDVRAWRLQSSTGEAQHSGGEESLPSSSEIPNSADSGQDDDLPF